MPCARRSERSDWQADGFVNTASWLRERCRLMLVLDDEPYRWIVAEARSTTRVRSVRERGDGAYACASRRLRASTPILRAHSARPNTTGAGRDTADVSRYSRSCSTITRRVRVDEARRRQRQPERPGLPRYRLVESCRPRDARAEGASRLNASPSTSAARADGAVLAVFVHGTTHWSNAAASVPNATRDGPGRPMRPHLSR